MVLAARRRGADDEYRKIDIFCAQDFRRLDEKLLALAHKLDPSDATDHKTIRRNVVILSKLGPEACLIYRKFFDWKSVVHDDELGCRRKLVGDCARDANYHFRTCKDVSTIPFPWPAELSVPITDMPHMRYAGHAGAERGGQNGSNIRVNK